MSSAAYYPQQPQPNPPKTQTAPWWAWIILVAAIVLTAGVTYSLTIKSQPDYQPLTMDQVADTYARINNAERDPNAYVEPYESLIESTCEFMHWAEVGGQTYADAERELAEEMAEVGTTRIDIYVLSDLAMRSECPGLLEWRATTANEAGPITK